MVIERIDNNSIVIPLLEVVIKASKNKIKINIEIKRNGYEKNLVENVIKWYIIITRND